MRKVEILKAIFNKLNSPYEEFKFVFSLSCCKFLRLLLVGESCESSNRKEEHEIIVYDWILT